MGSPLAGEAPGAQRGPGMCLSVACPPGRLSCSLRSLELSLQTPTSRLQSHTLMLVTSLFLRAAACLSAPPHTQLPHPGDCGCPGLQPS